LTEEVERAFLDRYRRLPAAAQTLLLIAAADHSGRTATITRAATGLGAGADTLDVAERSGLVEVAEGILVLRTRLSHRRSVMRGAISSRRRPAHRAVAGSPDEVRREGPGVVCSWSDTHVPS
jgi:hypothetical protein